MIEINKGANTLLASNIKPFEQAKIDSSNGSSNSNGDPFAGTDPANIIDCKSKVSTKDLNVGDIFFGTVSTTVKSPDGKKVRVNPLGLFQVMEKTEDSNGITYTVQNSDGQQYKTSKGGIKLRSYKDEAGKAEELKQKLEELKKQKEEAEKKAKEVMEKQEEFNKNCFDFANLSPEEKLLQTVKTGTTNIWMVGPAGCGKSTMARNLASAMELPYLCISCGIGTSATEFVGYKYPEREATKFSEYYSKPSVILIDEFTALDPAVAQVCNAALANGEIETTTGLVHRHPECIIIATSNTFGNGADRQYVANNQLDASTIDRFVGGIIEVDYSPAYESQFDPEVVDYVKQLRCIIKDHSIRRIASTRMIQAGHKMKENFFKDWKERLIINWSESEKKIVEQNLVDFWTQQKDLDKQINSLIKNKLAPEIVEGETGRPISTGSGILNQIQYLNLGVA